MKLIMKYLSKKGIIGFVALLCCAATSFAIDIVTLKNGTVLRGEIYQKDEDGSLMMNLTNGNKRYVMPDEIASTANDGTPFKLEKGAVGSSSAKNSSDTPIDIMVYAGYEHIMPTSVVEEEKKYNVFSSSPGFVVGVGFQVPLLKNLNLMPGLEFAYNKLNINKGFRVSKHGQDWMRFRVPIQIGYDFKMTNNIGLYIHTGPVLDCFIDAFHSSDDIFYEHNRFNLDWRFGARFNFKRYSLGISYSIGMTDRLKDYSGYYEYEFKMRQNSLQVSVGVNF